MWPYQIYKDARVLQLHSLFLLCQPVMISLSGRHKLGKGQGGGKREENGYGSFLSSIPRSPSPAPILHM